MSADENDETAENMPGGGRHANTMNLSGAALLVCLHL